MKQPPPFRLDVADQSLWTREHGAVDRRVPLSPKGFAMLRFLMERAGRLVTHEELLQGLWPETHVQPEVLKSHIRDIRVALGDDPKNPRFVETVPRLGYRFIPLASEPDLQASSPLHSEIVGRAAELNRLQSVLQDALQGSRQVVFITGGPGIGKTALVEAFLHRQAANHPELHIGRGQCVEGYGGKEPYYPVLEAIWQLCRGPAQALFARVLASHAPTWMLQFPALATPEQRDRLQRELMGATRERMLREIADALETIAAEHPLLFFLEDLHWADPSTLDFVSVLARRRLPARLLLLATYRPADSAELSLTALKQDLLVHHLCREIPLQRLEKAHVAEYLSLRANGRPVQEDMIGLIYRHCEGNPLFMEAALTHLQDQGLLTLENTGWRIKMPLQEIEVLVPVNVGQMIELQIEQIGIEQQRVLEVMSLLLKLPFSLSLGARVTGMTPEKLEEVLDGLAVRHQVVRRAGEIEFAHHTSPCYEFLHVLYRQVFYNKIGAVRRRKLHQKIAESGQALYAPLEEEFAIALAYHSEQGEDWPTAVTHLSAAADTAARRFEPAQAAELLEHALTLTGKIAVEQRAHVEIQLLQKLCTVYSTSFDPRAMRTYELLASRAAHYGFFEEEVHALLEMAFPLALVNGDQFLRALDRGFAAQSCYQQQDDLKWAAMRALYLSRRMGAGKWELHDLQECRELFEKLQQAGDHRFLGEVQLGLAYNLFNFSEYREAHRHAAQGFTRFLEVEDAPYLTWHSELHQHLHSFCPLYLGEWGEALHRISEYEKLLEKNGDRCRMVVARLQLAQLQVHAEDFAGAIATLKGLAAEVGSVPFTRRLWLIWAGAAEQGSGNPGQALNYLRQCRTELERYPLATDWYTRLALHWRITEAWLSKREAEQARIEAEEFLRIAEPTGERTFHALAWEANARAALLQRDGARARNCIARALEALKGYEVPLAAWRTHATAASIYEFLEEPLAAALHAKQSHETITRIASSMPPDEPLRNAFLSAPAVRAVFSLRDSLSAQASAR